jgi:CMP-N,N'-diacetyllegionaminic acid synthase
MSVVAVIPARGGSKQLPRKNILPLAGQPLLAYTIRDAKEATRVDRTIVSTDDPEIAAIAKVYGADVPFVRPAELATDGASTEVVLQHALLWLEREEGARIDVIVLLEATSPFRAAGLVDAVVARLDDPDVDTAFTAVRDHGYFWSVERDRPWPVRLDPDGYQPRQVRTPRWRETGSVYATRAAVVRGGERIGARVALVEQDEIDALVDVHTAFDLWLAERMVAEGRRGA